MNRRILFIALFLIGSIFSAFAGNVPLEKAKKVAENFYWQALNSFDKNIAKEISEIDLSHIETKNTNSQNSFYVFNVNKDNGFIIVSSHSYIKPILAYSFSSSFNSDYMSPGQQAILKYYNKSIEFAIKNNLHPDTEIIKQWGDLLSYKSGGQVKSMKSAGPLLGTIKWNQTWPYNSHCPRATGGTGGHVPVGCVATSMLQMMKYYNYPESGEGEIFHSSWANGGYGDYHINFSDYTYDWTAIPDRATGKYNEELGVVNLHGAVAVRVHWTPTGSASSTYRIAEALRNYFKYSPDLSLQRKDEYDEEDWKEMLRDQIDNNIPMVYSGFGTSSETGIPTGGHAWNCDGYQGDDHFHMNWGWGGAGDGYYTLDNLISTATAGGSENNFDHSQQAIIDIFPREDFPKYCENKIVVTGWQGSFDDGSSILNYKPNTNCLYIIEPECGNIISLDFPRFDLADGDFVKVYEGVNTSGNLLATFDSQNHPEDQTITSHNGVICINFVTNSGSVAKGWKASYRVQYCQTNIPVTKSQGSFDDGSGVCEYENSTVCSWVIQPDGAESIDISFSEFDLGAQSHFVRIFKNSMASANTIETFDSSNPPTQTVSVPSGVAVVQFFAGSGDVGQGWKINYSSVISNIDENEIISDISLVPNPGDNNSHIIFNTERASKAKFSVFNILGEQIAIKDVYLNDGNNRIQINEIVDSVLESGVYFVNIYVDNQAFTNKFVVLK